MCVIGPFFDGHRKGLLSAEWLPFGLAPHRWKFKLITCIYLFIAIARDWNYLYVTN